MTKLDRTFLTIVLISAVFSLYQVFVNDERLTEQKATLDSLQNQLKTVTEQVDKQQEFIQSIDTLYVSEIVGVVKK